MADSPSNVPPVNEARPAGMDHAHYAVRFHPDAPRFAWPDGARIAFTVMIVLDHWELQPPGGAEAPDPRIVSPLGKFQPDWLTWSQRQYGARVGIFRLLQTLDRFGLTPSVALGAAAAEHYPELVDECMRRGACFLAHGTHASRRISQNMTEAEERAFIAASRAAIHAATGTDPAGWCGQDFNESTRTPAMLAEAGFSYTTDWCNDDRPYLLGPYGGKHLLAYPPQPEFNDLEVMALRHVTPPVWADMIDEAFHVLHEEGGGVFNLTLHPHVAGQAHRIGWLHKALNRVLGAGKVWHATTDDVAKAARAEL